jgi:hypothetical protein
MQNPLGPIAWLLVGEIFPQRVRSAAVGTATLTNFSSNFLVSLSLPSLFSTFGTAGTYYFFSAMVGPGGCCSPRHMVLSNSRNEGSKCVG